MGYKYNIRKTPRKTQTIGKLKKNKNLKDKKKRRLPIIPRRRVIVGIVLIVIRMDMLMKVFEKFIILYIPTRRRKRRIWTRRMQWLPKVRMLRRFQIPISSIVYKFK